MDRARLGLWGTFAFATLAVFGMAVQVYLIGGFIFGQDGWLDTHKDLGKLVHLFYILTFVASIIGFWPNWRASAWPLALAVVGTIQAFLAAGGDVGGDNGGLHAFHAALVPIVLLIAVAVAWRAWTALQEPPLQEPPTVEA